MLLALPATVQALGISAPQTRSALGQPLELLFPINLGANESLAVECVHAEVVAGDAHIPTSLVTLRLEGANESSVHAVRLQSLTQVNEPIVTVTLSLGCPARVTRQYVALVDPPSPVAATTLPPLPEVVPGQDVRSQSYSPALRAALDASESKPELLLAEPPVSAATVAARAASPQTPAASAPTGKPRAATPTHVVTAAADGATPAAAAPRKKSKRPAAPREPRATQMADAGAAKPVQRKEVSRLHMDAPEIAETSSTQVAVAASSPASAASEAAAVSAAASDPTAIRLAAMEDRLNQMQQQNREQQNKLLQVQAKLDAAQAERYQNPFVWMLGLLVLGLGGLSAYLWRSRKAARESWWGGENSAPSPVSHRPAAPTPARATPGLADLSSPDSAMPVSILNDEMTAPLPLLAEGVSTLGGLQPPPQVTVEYQHHQHQDTLPAAIADPGAPVTVEELLDMQQQVEFFLVLGQADAAIDLLRSRVDTGSSSALPYLKLMEIYQSQGDVASFADLGKRFSERFNAVPPAWGGDMNEGRTLDGYAEVLASVQKVWGDAAVSMALLQNLLTFGPEGDELQGFDLPAYRDLLLLYSLARDLSEHDVRGDEIDLFLPLDGGARNAATGMMATMSWSRNTAPAQLDVDVDISLDDEPARQDAHDEGTPTDFQPPDKI